MYSFFNNSRFVARIRGKEENVNDFLDLLQYNHPKKIGFYNLSNVQEDLGSKTSSNDLTLVTIVGECNGSFEVCTFDTPGSHFRNYKDSPKIHFMPTEILKETRRLNIEIEIYSDNIANFTTEYFHINNGILLEKKIYVDGKEVGKDWIEKETVLYVPDYDFKF